MRYWVAFFGMFESYIYICSIKIKRLFSHGYAV